MDRRERLKEGTHLHAAGNKVITIGREIGRGASCIVYDAEYTDHVGAKHQVRVRECCPDYLPLKRDTEGKLVPSFGEYARFEKEKQRFRESYRRNVRIQNMLGLVNSTVNVDDLLEAHQTCYAILSFDEGMDYQAYQDHTLKELLEHIRSVAILIEKYHENGYLHLDIRPENVFVIPETTEHILLFDFESVMTMEELKANGSCRLSFSEGFSAPEQIQGRIGKMGYHTDIYSIGALTFYKVFGRKPEVEDGRLSAEYDFSHMNCVDRRFQPKLYRKLEEFFRNSLSVSTVSRWNHMEPVLTALDELIRLADAERVFVYDTFQYNSGCFIGREEELRKIHEILQDHQLVFLSGIGGIGKTELARKYAQRYRNDYDTIVFSVYRISMQELLNQDIRINGIVQEELEDDRSYFKRKLGILKETLTSDDLVLIDNFDMDQDEDLEELFACSCRFIITTREDFRDYNYPQLDVDRMENMDEVMQLFGVYNTCNYTDSEKNAVFQILSLVDGHTMTVELIAKYLRDTGECPGDLYQRFLEKEGTTNTEEIRIKQRKDRRLRAESVNDHIRILFNVSDFSPVEKELICSLSLLGGIRISKRKFQEWCRIGSDTKELDHLIRRGWIEYNEETDKIALHQIIQDLVYLDLSPDAENCPNLVRSMIQYWNAEMANDSERQVRRRVVGILMERLTGSSLLYAKLCVDYGKMEYLEKAEKICQKSPDREALDLLHRICRKKIEDTAKCEDIFESELNWDAYYRDKFLQITELLDKTVGYCKRYSDSPDYLAKIGTAIGTEVDALITNEFMVTASDGRIEELDRLYQRIMKVLDLATENIFQSGLEDSEKEELLIKIRDFYTDKDVMALYRCAYFLDVEKVCWYQEQIDRLGRQVEWDEEGRIICIHADSLPVSNRDLAYMYEAKGEYDNAVRYYEKAYEEREELSELILYDLVKVCEQAGYMEQAEEHLRHILEIDRSKGDYSNDACVELIRILVSGNRLEAAEELAQELLCHNKVRIQETDNADAVIGMTEAYYWLFVTEEDPESKRGFWENAVLYYRMLDPGGHLTDDLREFITEYIRSMETSESLFREALELLKRTDKYQGKKLIQEIYKQILLVSRQEGSYGTWYIQFLLMYAEFLDDLVNQQYAEALHYCEMAQQYYDCQHMKDSYIQNRIVCIMAECMSNIKEYDFEQIQRIRKTCDYTLLAERETESDSCSDQEKYEAWRTAADRYGYIDCFGKERYCIQRAIDVILPVLGQYEYSSYANYYRLVHDRIRCSMRLDGREQTYGLITEMYDQLLNDREKFKKEDIPDWEWWNQYLADDLADLDYTEEAARLYLYILYVAVTVQPDICLIKDLCPDKQIEVLFYERLEAAVKGKLNHDAINWIVSLEKKIVSLLRPGSWEFGKRYADLMEWFSGHYEHQEIEFKRE